MSHETFDCGGRSLNITINAPQTEDKRHPFVLFVHGNFGLGSPYGPQIRGFAEDLAKAGYVTAVPHLYPDEKSNTDDIDPEPHVETLTAAIAKVASRADVDQDRLGLVGFSLGAAAAMSYVASRPAGSVKALADFFGFLTPTIQAGLDKFPPTIIFHNEKDSIVPISFSIELDRLLPNGIAHLLVPYDEIWPPGNHAFRLDHAADLDSREKTKSWFTTHLPPGADDQKLSGKGDRS